MWYSTVDIFHIFNSYSKYQSKNGNVCCRQNVHKIYFLYLVVLIYQNNCTRKSKKVVYIKKNISVFSFSKLTISVGGSMF